jgi:hypothetical protein
VGTLNSSVVTMKPALRRDTITLTHCTRARDVTSHTVIVIWISITVRASYPTQNVPDHKDVHLVLSTKFYTFEQFNFGEDTPA